MVTWFGFKGGAAMDLYAQGQRDSDPYFPSPQIQEVTGIRAEFSHGEGQDSVSVGGSHGEEMS
jgi:hypothetical protein